MSADIAAVARPEPGIDSGSYAKAILNILEDSQAEREQLEDTQRAMLNILEDFEDEKRALRLAKGAADAANRELEAFSYSVAHDLRAPLRSIDGFSQILLEDYADKLDAEGKTHLSYVRESAQQMARLIDDLLALSRVSRGDLKREPIDLAPIARLVLARLQKKEPERKVVLVVPVEVAAVGDRQLLGIVLENLLGNAWKFTSKQPAARIELGHRVEAGRSIYFVRDDGAGFDMTYAEKLFGAFQRLHSSHEFEGTGIGLATVQRIVRRHGGSVWAEGEVGHGATFYFALEETK